MPGYRHPAYPRTGTTNLLAQLNGFNPVRKRVTTVIYRGSHRGTGPFLLCELLSLIFNLIQAARQRAIFMRVWAECPGRKGQGQEAIISTRSANSMTPIE